MFAFDLWWKDSAGKYPVRQGDNIANTDVRLPSRMPFNGILAVGDVKYYSVELIVNASRCDTVLAATETLWTSKLKCQ